MARTKQSPKIIVLAATKGGVGKTTLSTALAVRASEGGDRVALIDADPQASLERWWQLRQEPDNPMVLDIACSAEAIGLLASEGWDYVIVDTPPALVDEIEQAISMADFVLIPTRASAFDLEAVDQVVQICESEKKPFAFVINAAQPNWKLTASSRRYLEHDGKVFNQLICYRRSYISAPTLGKTGPEIEKDGKCAEEIDGLWAELKAALRKAARAR